MKHILAPVLACLAMLGITEAADNMKAFPPASNGMTRYVITLPREDNEARLKVELLIGKTVRLDPGNHYFFGGKVQTQVVQGWGFSYYVLPKLGPMAGTLMAVDPDVPKVDRFISLAGEPTLLQYNSKLPLVVYVPDDVEVRYRIWRAPAKAIKARQG